MLIANFIHKMIPRIQILVFLGQFREVFSSKTLSCVTFRYSFISFICLWLHRLVKHPHDVEQTYNDEHHHWNGEIYKVLNCITFCFSFVIQNTNTELNITLADYFGWFWIYHMYLLSIRIWNNLHMPFECIVYFRSYQ